MDGGNQSAVTCTVAAVDHNNIMYQVCSTCEKTLGDDITDVCKNCNFPSNPKRLFRILMSIATDTNVVVVIMFDRAAKVLFGCSADDFFELSKIHPFAAEDAGKFLEGEMLTVTLTKPKNGNAQHQRVVSVSPLRSGFQTAIHELRDLYKVSSRS